jgi:hypothetical protein
MGLQLLAHRAGSKGFLTKTLSRRYQLIMAFGLTRIVVGNAWNVLLSELRMTNLCNRPPYQKISPEVKRLDKLFLAWLRKRNCIICMSPPPNDPAHVRRASNGGIGAKPVLSAIPLCRACHQLQHKQGESALGGKEWFDAQALIHKNLFLKETGSKEN